MLRFNKSDKGKSNLLKKNFQFTCLRVFGAFVALFVNIILARTFQAENIGQYFISLGVIIFIAQLSTLGSEKWLVKKLSTINNNVEKQKEISLVIFLVFLFSSISYIIYKLFFVNLFSVRINLNIFELYTVAFFYISISIFQANNKVLIGLLFQYILQPVIFLVLVLSFSLPLIKLYLASILICLSIAIVYLFSSGCLRLRRFNICKITSLLKSISPYFSILLFGLAVTHLSLPLSSFWLDDEGIAVMGIIIRLINILNFTITGTRILLLPRYSRAIHEKNKQEIFKLSSIGRTSPTFFVVIGCFIFTIFGEKILMTFGSVYADYYFLLILSSLLLLPVAYYSWHQSYLIANNQVNLVNVSSMITTIIVFTLIILLAPLYGVFGAVLAVIIGKTIYTLLTAYLNSSFNHLSN